MFTKHLRSIVSALSMLAAFIVISFYLSGCSAAGGNTVLMQITPEQYMISAKEELETIEERDYEVRDLEEVIRVLENAEKNAKKTETIDRTRLYLILANSLLARKKYRDHTISGDYIGNNPEPFYIVDSEDVRSTLRTAKKWLRMCDSQFKTDRYKTDLNYVRGIYYTQKMLTVHERDRKEYANRAILGFRRCLGMAPGYKADFRIFSKDQTPREVRLRMAEAMAFGGMQAEAYGLISEFSFEPIVPVSGANLESDYAWQHTKGFILATMGLYKEAAKELEVFKIISPSDYMNVDEALYYLQGIYERLAETTKDKRYNLEASLIASILNKLEGPFSNESYVTSAHLFPKPLNGDVKFFEGIVKFYNGEFDAACEIFESLRTKSIMTRANRNAALLYETECLLYTGRAVPDDIIESLLQLTDNNEMSQINKDRLAFLLARYVMEEDTKLELHKVSHDSQTFIRSIYEKPWALDLTFNRGRIKKINKKKVRNTRNTKKDEKENEERESSSITLEAYCNKVDDWIVSASMYIISLPDMTVIGNGKIVGREDNDKLVFKDERIDALKKGEQYLIVIEYDNSDSEKSIQGVLFTCK